MKYKKIKSMLHNFGHSFCSDMNTFANSKNQTCFIFKEINSLFSEDINLASFCINFSTQEVTPKSVNSPAFKYSIQNYAEVLKDHSKRHDLNIDCIRDVELTFLRSVKKNGKAFICVASCIDDRGIKHAAKVKRK